MRKRIIHADQPEASTGEANWLDLEHLAIVEVTSEEADHPIEAAFLPGRDSGWRASQAGAQTIRLLFDEPQRLSRIRLRFDERETARTQDFTLRWSADGGRTYREIVRQHWNFSPPDTACEEEEYRVELAGVTALELVIVPDISGEAARASLSLLRLA